MVSFEEYIIVWFTDLLNICDNISHLQTGLAILFLRIVKQNHCFCCGGMCVLVVVEEEEGVKEGRGEQGECIMFASNVGGVR